MTPGGRFINRTWSIGGCVDAGLTQGAQLRSVAAARSTGLRLLHFSDPERFRGLSALKMFRSVGL